MQLFGWDISRIKEKKLRNYNTIIDSWVAGMEHFDSKNPTALINAYAGWVYVCADRNAKAVAKQNIRLYVTKPEGEQSLVPTKTLSPSNKLYLHENYESQINKAYKELNQRVVVEEVLVHPFLDLMRNINPFFNKTDFLYLSQLFLELTGNSYWGIGMNGLRIPGELWQLPSQNMSVIPDKQKFISGYKYRNDSGEERIYDPSLIVHHKFPYPGDLFLGTSPLSAVASAVNISNYSNTYLKAIYKNMGVIPGYFTTKENLRDHEFDRLNEQLNKYRGAKNAGSTPLFDNDLKFESVAVNPKDLFSAIASKASREEIAAAFGVPLSLITVESVNRSNAESGNYTYFRDTISPRLKFIEEKMTETVLPKYAQSETAKLFCAFDNPVKEDNEQIRKVQETNLKWGVDSINEVRKEQGKSPISDGDRRLVPLNYIYADKLDEYHEAKKQPKAENGQGGENTER